jgi:PhoH-like ATPase
MCSNVKNIIKLNCMAKTYILDTNVLLSDPNSLNAFEENDIIVPLAVLEELDRHKSRQDEVGANARQINRKLDDFRQSGSLFDGVKTIGGGTLRVMSVNKDDLERLPLELRGEKVDNMIIALTKQLQQVDSDSSQYILVSKDVNVRIKCDAINVKCEDYRKSRVVSSASDMYTGVCVLESSREFIDSLHDNEREIFAPEEWSLYPNQVVVIKEFGVQSGSTIVRAIKKGEKFVLKIIKQMKDCYGLQPRNKEQNFSLDILYDPEIKLVTLSGIAGSGKSLLALAAGLDQNKIMGTQRRYNKLIVARALQPVGKDTGFLPGTLIEKLMPWQASTTDNLNFLMNRGGKKEQLRSKASTSGQLLDPYFSLLMEKGVIEIASISHIRGRSIPDSFFIVEEGQNLSHAELKTIMTRVGEGTKMIICGDVEQIDAAYLDKTSNGLTYVIEKFKESSIAAHITLLKGERSALATQAAQLL